MTQKHHVRHVEIRTLTASCDECDFRSAAKGADALINDGWRLVGISARETPRDLCPDCAEVARGLERAAAENEARRKHIAAIEEGEPIYVHGRVYAEPVDLHTPDDARSILFVLACRCSSASCIDRVEGRLMQRIALVLVLLAGCAGPAVVPADDGSTPADARESDAGMPTDAEVPDDASEPPADAWRPAPGTCEPDRAPDAISHTDCRSLRDRPICDAISERCVALPDDYCGACRTDADCAAFDHNARCVFMPGDAPSNNDSACLIPCSGNSDCDFLRDDPAWSAVQCYTLPAGSFCVPYTVVSPHCRDGSGNRI